jgi:hypothetical protein
MKEALRFLLVAAALFGFLCPRLAAKSDTFQLIPAGTYICLVFLFLGVS